MKNKQRRVKKGFIYFEVLNKTIRFDSILELSFIFFKEGKLERCKRFQYENNEEVHFYQPDFVIEDQKIEIKSKKEFDMNKYIISLKALSCKAIIITEEQIPLVFYEFAKAEFNKAFFLKGYK